MSFALRLAWKYFRAGRKSLARLTAAVAVAGIAAGVASLVFAQALARGFADEMRDKILANTPHLAVSRRDEGELADWREIQKILKNVDNVKNVAAASSENAVVTSADAVAYAVLRTRETAETDADRGRPERRRRRRRSPPTRSPSASGSPPDSSSASARRSRSRRSKSRRRAGCASPDCSRPAFTITTRRGSKSRPPRWRDFAGKQSSRRGVTSLSVTDIYQSDETARRVRAALGEQYLVVDWQEANRPLFAALSLERRVALAIISLIVFVAALNITTTLALLVNERRLDIAMLRVCGAGSRVIAAVFALEGLALAVAGVALGLSFGLAGCRLADRFRLVSLPAEVYEIGYVPLRPAAGDILLISAAVLALALAASLYPALKASRLKPLENLRRQ